MANAAGSLTLIVFNFTTYFTPARITARLTLLSLIFSMLAGILNYGINLILLLHVFQIASIVAFQIATDEGLKRNTHFEAPWHKSTDETRKEYIPLNFFNLFWVFAIASICGLVVEVIYHAIVFGGYEDRAGLIWGPFSPIYGFGATLMTVALNRWWNRSVVVIFLVAGVIGAAFEFATSWFMETAFGIVAWDYSGTFLNIQGRTNFAFFCAWGMLGLVWIRILLPELLRVVDAIPLKWRAGLTTIFALFMLIDGMMTLVALDCWYSRESGAPIENAGQQFFADHFDNTFMENRFQSMSIHPDQASRS